MTLEDVHIFHSEPPSPKKPLALLPPPPTPSSSEPPTISLNISKGKQRKSVNDERREEEVEIVEEGTPEDIRRRFFPHVPQGDPSLEWIEGVASSSAGNSKEIRYDFSGLPIPPSKQSTLPSHLGLHHHGENPERAGYTLEDLYTLSRSSVRSQRASALGILARIVRRMSESHAHSLLNLDGHNLAGNDGSQGSGKDEKMKDEMSHKAKAELRHRTLVLGLWALSEKGSIGAQAIDLVYACIVLWDQADVDGIEGIELMPTSGSFASLKGETNGEVDEGTDLGRGASQDMLSDLPLETLLMQIASMLTSPSGNLKYSQSADNPYNTHPPHSLSQLLAILVRLAAHSTRIAGMIMNTEGLVDAVVKCFLIGRASTFYLSLSSVQTPSTSMSMARSEPEDRREQNAEVDPDTTAFDLFKILARSSRANAEALLGPMTPLLRFITSTEFLPPAYLDQNTSNFAALRKANIALELVAGTLEVYAIVSGYGLYSSTATTAAEQFARLGTYILTLPPTMAPPSSVNDVTGQMLNATMLGPKLRLCISWLRVIEGWMVCARDPHRTTPAHDLLWSQVVGWSWVEDILSFRSTLLQVAHGEEFWELWAAVWDVLAAWLEGSATNAPRAGLAEKQVITAAFEELIGSGGGGDGFGRLEEGVVQKTCRMLKKFLGVEMQRKGDFVRIRKTCRVLSAFTRLSVACIPRPESSSPYALPEVPPWVMHTHSLLSSAAFDLLSSSELGRSSARRTDEPLYKYRMVFARYASAFLAHFSTLHGSASLQKDNGLGSRVNKNDSDLFGIATLTKLSVGYEQHALSLITSFIYTLDGPSQTKASLLIPFFIYMLNPSLDPINVAPLYASPHSISSSSTQTLPADCEPLRSSQPFRAKVGLPLREDWTTVALDHLLRSGSSVVLTDPDRVPEGWNASEIELAQASLGMTLALSRRFTDYLEKDVTSRLRKFAPTMEECALACMKVFMLEHNNPTSRTEQPEASEEVFRNPAVGQLMEGLLQPFCLSSNSSPQSSLSDPASERCSERRRHSIENVSEDFLGIGTPFFQFYTDFLALYDAISFSHRTFAQLLLPPLASFYAPDYRRLLFGDNPHVLRTIKTRVGDILISGSSGIEHYLYPSENDPEMVGYYLRALVSGPTEGFIRFFAIHHVASMIWPDLRGDCADLGYHDQIPRGRSLLLLVAIFKQANPDVVKEVVMYSQSAQEQSEGETMSRGERRCIKLPPRCFEAGDMVKKERIEFVKGDARVEEAVASILGNKN